MALALFAYVMPMGVDLQRFNAKQYTDDTPTILTRLEERVVQTLTRSRLVALRVCAYKSQRHPIKVELLFMYHVVKMTMETQIHSLAACQTFCHVVLTRHLISVELKQYDAQDATATVLYSIKQR